MQSSKQLVTLVLATSLAACTADDPELGSAQQAVGEAPADAGAGDADVAPDATTKGPTLNTDKADYIPGETVTFTGAGFQPGETVTITLIENPSQHAPDILTAVANDSGAITNNEYAPEQHDVGTLYTATAVGSLSGRSATTGFSDAGATGGGNIDHYTITTSTGASLAPLGTNRVANTCDDCTTSITLPWTMRLYNQTFNTAVVSSNGNLQFGSNSAAYSWTQLSNAPFQYTILPLWADLWTWANQGGAPSDIGIYTSLTGNHPHQDFHIRWHVVYCCGGTNRADFELVLHEDDPGFDFVYGAVAAPSAGTAGVMKDQGHVTQFTIAGSPTQFTSGLKVHFTGVQATNQAPVANAGPDQTLNCLAHNQEVPVALDGSLSSDPDGNPLTYQWLLGQTQLATGVRPTVQLAPGNYNVTLSVSDGALSSTDSVALSLLEDLVAPIITLNAGASSLECGSTYSDPGASAHDDCSGNITPTVSGAVDGAHVGNYTLVYSATDGNNHTATASRTISVTDSLAPVISVNPGPASAECATPYTDPGASALDRCVGTLPAPANRAVDTSHTGAQTITYSASDGVNAASATRTVTVQDTIPPVLSVHPGASAVECGDPYADPGASATDTCSGTLTPSVSGAVDGAHVGSYTLTYSATDGSNHTVTGSRTVSVQDTLAPVITQNAGPARAECAQPYADPGATALDHCVGALPATADHAIDTSHTGPQAIIYSANDGHNTTTSTRNVSVEDTIPPALTLVPGDPLAECGMPYADPGAAATDACAGDLTARIQVSGGVSTASVGDNHIDYSVTDGFNTTTATRAVTVVDRIAPDLTINPGAPTLECGDAYTDPGASAHDACSGNLAPSVEGAVDGSHIGDYTLTYRATDGANHTTSGSRSVSVQDTLAPVITLNAGPARAECAQPYTDPGATALDHCVGALPATADHAINTAHTGAQTITYSSTDGHNNSSSATRSVTVEDTIAPTLTLNPGDPLAECGLPYSDPGAHATDSCAGDLTGSIQVSGGVSTASVGENHIGYSVSDGFNTSTAARSVTVVDRIAPELTLNGAPSVTLECGIDPYVEAGAMARDICVGDLTAAIQISSPPSNHQLGSTAVFYTVSDGHTAPVGASRAVTVIDTLAPRLTPMSNVHVEATGPNGATAQFFAAAATDACDPAPQVSCDHASGQTFPLGSTVVTCVARDLSGNLAQTQFTVEVVDTTPPTLAQPSDVFVTATSIAGATATFPTPSATDIVDLHPTVSCVPASGSTFAPGATTVTCTASDFSGNSTQKTFVVHVSYGWSGFLQPINVDGSSVFKLGSTIPVKFALAGASAGITNLTARIYVAKVANNVTGSEVEAISTANATTGNLFRYDPTAGQYIFNLATKGLSTGTWQIRADFGDGALHTVLVSLK